VTTDGTLRLTDLLGRPVVASDGRSLGRLADLAIDHEDRFPRVTALAIRAGRTITVRPWSAVRGLGPPVVLDPGAGECRADLYLAHDLLDAQVIDIAGRRLARVSEIALALHGGALRAVAVDVGLGSVVRRLGLGRLASRMGDEMIGWDGLHFASGRGHHVQLASPAAAVHTLEPGELMEVVSRLPPERGEELRDAVPAARALPRRAPRRRFPVMRVRRRAPS
jgi:sporulation protein YlmC with PRC-barrel domain